MALLGRQLRCRRSGHRVEGRKASQRGVGTSAAEIELVASAEVSKRLLQRGCYVHMFAGLRLRALAACKGYDSSWLIAFRTASPAV